MGKEGGEVVDNYRVAVDKLFTSFIKTLISSHKIAASSKLSCCAAFSRRRYAPP
jgi:hypothetical protein